MGIRNNKKLLVNPDFFHPAIIVTAEKVTPRTQNKGNLFSQHGNSCSDICCTPAIKDLPVRDVRRTILCREMGDPANMVNRGVTDNMDHSGCTSSSFRGTSRSAFPITDFAIRSACSGDSARKTFISRTRPTRAVSAKTTALERVSSQYGQVIKPASTSTYFAAGLSRFPASLIAIPIASSRDLTSRRIHADSSVTT